MAEKILNRPEECRDGNAFYLIVKSISDPSLKRMAGKIILDRFPITHNLEIVIEQVPSLKKRAKEMLDEAEQVREKEPDRLLARILNFKI